MTSALIFVFNKKISLKSGIITFKLDERIFKNNRWLPKGPKKSLYLNDLNIFIKKFKNPRILKTIIEGELTIRRREGRFFSETDDISLLRLDTLKAYIILKELITAKLAVDDEGKPLKLKNPQPLKIEFASEKENFTLKVSVNEISITDTKNIFDAFPPLFLHKDLFIPFRDKITKKFLSSLPLNNTLNKTGKDKLIKRLSAFIDAIEIKREETEQKIIKDSPCLPLVELSANAQNARLLFMYEENIIVSAEEKKLTLSFHEQKVQLNRNIIEEKEYLKIFTKAGFIPQKTSEFDWYLPSSKTFTAIKFLNYEGFTVTCFGKEIKTDLNLSLKTSVKNDLIRIKPELFLNEKKFSAQNLLFSVNSGSPFFSLNEESLAILNFKEQEKINRLLVSGKISDENINIDKKDFALLKNTISPKDYEADSDIRNLFNITDKNQISASIEELPDTIKSILRKYQQKGVSWLLNIHNNGFNAILADDMGLGKTLQTLAFFSLIYKKINIPSLLVVPSSLIFNWIDEINKFTPFIKYLNYSGADRNKNKAEFSDKDLIITTYSLIRNDFKLFSDSQWNYIILDEAQAVKNPFSKTSIITKKIKSRGKLSITGTPIENTALDLWNHFDFLMPGFLKKREEFIEKYNQPEQQTILKTKTAPFILRRMKDEVLKELPPKTEIVIKCSLSSYQKVLYKEMMIKARKQLNDEQKVTSVLEILLRLRQIACSPYLISKNKEDLGRSDKTLQVMDFINEILGEGHNILVFSQFTSHLKIFRTLLNEQNIPFHYLDGSSTDREEIIKNFKTDKNNSVFLISLKAGGQGLNLTEASYVFLLDPWWNPQVENQAIDRCHRIGQEKPVTIYRFITEGSIEEKVLKLSKSKKELEEQIISSTDVDKKFSKDKMLEMIFNPDIS